jgi:dihydrofolate reductase
VAEDPVELVRRLTSEPGAGIWLAGGARLAGALLPEIDRLVLERCPVVLGAGIPVIASSRARPQAFTITDERALGDGATITTDNRTA